MACEICRNAEFVNVEAVKFVSKGEHTYIKPCSWIFHARYCPGCGEKMPNTDVSLVGGEDGRK